MGDAGIVVAEADAAVEGRSTEPNRAALLAAFQDAPETNMVAPVGAPPDRLLKGKVLVTVVVVQMADRRMKIRAVEQNAADDLNARAQRNRIGRVPAGGIHGAEHVLPRSDESDIDRI